MSWFCNWVQGRCHPVDWGNTMQLPSVSRKGQNRSLDPVEVIEGARNRTTSAQVQRAEQSALIASLSYAHNRDDGFSPSAVLEAMCSDLAVPLADKQVVRTALEQMGWRRWKDSTGELLGVRERIEFFVTHIVPVLKAAQTEWVFKALNTQAYDADLTRMADIALLLIAVKENLTVSQALARRLACPLNFSHASTLTWMRDAKKTTKEQALQFYDKRYEQLYASSE